MKVFEGFVKVMCSIYFYLAGNMHDVGIEV